MLNEKSCPKKVRLFFVYVLICFKKLLKIQGKQK